MSEFSCPTHSNMECEIHWLHCFSVVPGENGKSQKGVSEMAPVMTLNGLITTKLLFEYPWL